MMPAETMQASPRRRSAREARLVALAAPDSPAAEQYRVLYQRILKLAVRRPLRVLAVTSAGRREGRTTTAANLALTAAQEGRATVLVEADLRRPSLAAAARARAARRASRTCSPGRAELAQAIVRLGPLAVVIAGEGARRGRAAAGPAPPPRSSTSSAPRYELVVLDAPPALAFADGDRLSGDADAALLVVRAGATPRQVVRLALDALGERAVGIVLNDVDLDAVAHGRWIYPGEAPPRAG